MYYFALDLIIRLVKKNIKYFQPCSVLKWQEKKTKKERNPFKDGPQKNNNKKTNRTKQHYTLFYIQQRITAVAVLKSSSIQVCVNIVHLLVNFGSYFQVVYLPGTNITS